MNENTRNAFASYGLEILKRAALLVLYDARDEGLIKQDAVRKRLGIPNIDSKHKALIYGILMHLKADGYAHHKVRRGWQITEQGVSIIEG